MNDSENSSPQTTTDQRLRLPKLVRYREEAMQRRAEAFCDAPDFVMGQVVQPITPRTFSMLAAVQSHFVWGGTVTEGDVRNFLWFHSAEWGDCCSKGWQHRKARVLGRFERALVSPWRRRLRQPVDAARYGVTMALYTAEIARLFKEAFADCLAPTGGNSPALSTMEASLVSCFAMAYRWTPEVTRNTPLRKLFQYVRMIRHHNGEEISDAGEQEILIEHLRQRRAANNEGTADA